MCAVRYCRKRGCCQIGCTPKLILLIPWLFFGLPRNQHGDDPCVPAGFKHAESKYLVFRKTYPPEMPLVSSSCKLILHFSITTLRKMGAGEKKAMCTESELVLEKHCQSACRLVAGFNIQQRNSKGKIVNPSKNGSDI